MLKISNVETFYGKKIFEGTADQTKNSKEVIEAYLGVDE